MSDTTYIGQKIKIFNSAAEFEGFSRVVISVTDKLEYSSGTNTGRTLTLVCPWGTQEMADSILADIRGYRYHPYSADGAYLDPAAEIGDGVTVNGIYSGIYTMDAVFGRSFLANISAPSDEEIDHEYPYVPKQERTITRKFAQVESEFAVQADKISAKVSKTGGSNESFGWDLDEKSWTLKAKSKNVLLATEDGVEITGKIIAKSGKIGGFDILENYLSYNGQTWMGENSIGGYLGINGLQMGSKFRVNMQGDLYAASGTFEGNIYAKNIRYGEQGGVNYGTINGGAISAGSIVGGQFGQLSPAVVSSLQKAEDAYNVLFKNVRAKAIASRQVSADEILLDGKKLGMSSIAYVGTDGRNHSIQVVTWRTR